MPNADQKIDLCVTIASLAEEAQQLGLTTAAGMLQRAKQAAEWETVGDKERAAALAQAPASTK